MPGMGCPGDIFVPAVGSHAENDGLNEKLYIRVDFDVDHGRASREDKRAIQYSLCKMNELDRPV